MCNCLSLGPKTFAAWQKWRLSQWSRDFCLKKNVFDKLPRSNADIYWWRRGFHWLSRQRERRESREGQRLSMWPLLSTSQQSEQKVFYEFNYQQNMYKQDYFRKKTISEEWIYSMSTSFSKCRRWNCDDVKPPSSVWWRPGCFDFPPNGVWTIFHGSSLLRSSSGIYSRHLQSPRKSPAYTHLQCEDS